MLLFLADFVSPPLHTGAQMVEGLNTLATLVRNDEWGVIGEALAPEIYQLVTDWDTTPSDKRGELADYALGKYGTDILAPEAVAKIASRSVKSAKELTVVCRNLYLAEETLVLEIAAEVGNVAKIAEVIKNGQKTIRLADELGFTALI